MHYMPWFSESTGVHENPTAPQYTQLYPHDHLCNPEEEFPAWYPPIGGKFNSNDPVWVQGQIDKMKEYCIDGVIVDYGGIGMEVAGLKTVVELIVENGMKFAVMIDNANWGRTNAQNIEYATGQYEFVYNTYYSKHPNNVFKDNDGNFNFFLFGATPVPSESFRNVCPHCRYISENGIRPRTNPPGPVGNFGWGPTKGSMQNFYNYFCTNGRYCVGTAWSGMESMYDNDNYEPRCMMTREQLRDTLQLCFDAPSTNLCQIQTWNDWNEGTAVAPSHFCSNQWNFNSKQGWNPESLLEVIRDVKQGKNTAKPTHLSCELKPNRLLI